MKSPLTLFDRLVRLLGALGGFFVFAIIVIVAIDIAGRALFNAPLTGATTLATILLVCLIFMSLANVQKKKEHYRVDIVAELFPPRARKVIDILAHLVSLAVVGLLAKYSTDQAIASFQKGEVGYDLAALPIWPARIVLAAGLTILALQLVIDVVRDIRELLSSGES